MIMLDTAVLVDSLTGPKHSAQALRRALESGELVLLPALALYEWLRGPRLPQEIADQQALFPDESATLFGPPEAALSAQIYRAVPGARRREIDIAIAACAIVRECPLWTLNASDFKDIPGLRLYRPPAR
jgi:predicted nucleic acid-binding protein